MVEKEVSPKEARIRALTSIYYSKPSVQAALLAFAKGREVVPRYFEGFGKRPDTLQYPSDVMGLVSRGATSFHASEEIWHDPLQISNDFTKEEMTRLRSSWDLLIDIDSPYLDYSKIAARLVIERLERYGIRNYGIKFSGGKGFHIIVPGAAFPEEWEGTPRSHAFPEWPRAITEFLLNTIRPEYNKAITALGFDVAALERKTNLSREELVQTTCPQCAQPVEKHSMVQMRCDRCNTPYERPDYKITKKKLRCTNDTCPGFFEILEEKEFWKCRHCGLSSFNKNDRSSNKTVYSAKSVNYVAAFEQEIAGDKLGSLDLVLVSPRHLFRMPYSLHEKTSLASVVISKEQLAVFSPKDADPLRVVIREYYPSAIRGEGTNLLITALQQKGSQQSALEKERSQRGDREAIALTGVTDAMFPPSIQKLLKGLPDGKKRGLFILITFLKCAGFTPDSITARVFEWNKKNQPPLKEGYIQSQLNWHFKQKKQILPPNYENPSFYKDLGLLDKKPDTKNPIVDVMRKVRGERRSD